MSDLGATMAEIRADMERAAIDVVEKSIVDRARRYRADPALLDSLAPGLSTASAAELIATADALTLKMQQGQGQRWSGFGGENALLSLRAARRLGEEMLVEEQRRVSA